MIPQFATKEELLDFLKKNKKLILSEKMAKIKHADAYSYTGIKDYQTIYNGHEDVNKEFGIIAKAESGASETKLIVRSVINTTGILDSHGDVHIPGLWKKSLSESKILYHLQEHQMKFDKVISDEVKASAKSIAWKTLGYDFEGNTQALVFDSVVDNERNEYMYNQYLKGYVKNHSVGMRYVKALFCVNSEEKYWAEEKANWDKYIDQVANRQDAEAQFYFTAVLEAKVVEGSAVLVGSNQATPTISVTQSKDDNSEAAGKGTSDENTNEPDITTQEESEQTDKIGQQANAPDYSEIAKALLKNLNN